MTVEDKIEAGAFAWWVGGSEGDGHVVLIDAWPYVFSTDFAQAGYVGDGRVRRIHYAQVSDSVPSLKFVGFSRDINDVVCVPKEVNVFLFRPSNSTTVFMLCGTFRAPITAAIYTALGKPPVKIVDPKSALGVLPVIDGPDALFLAAHSGFEHAPDAVQHHHSIANLTTGPAE